MASSSTDRPLVASDWHSQLQHRITPELCEMLERHHPLWFNTHFNHPKEITEEAAEACDRLTRQGIVVQNQSVLLKGINDDLETIHTLLSRLLEIRVRPYYLYRCDNAVDISHFVTMPLGKISLGESGLHHDEKGYWVHNYEGKTMCLGEFLPFTEEEKVPAQEGDS